MKGTSIALACLAFTACSHQPRVIVVAPLNTPGQKILAEILAARLAASGLHVEHSRTYDSLAAAHQVLLASDADVAIEYTGAAYMAILHHPRPERQDLIGIRGRVRSEYAVGQRLKWFEPLGFADPFVLVIRRDAAEAEARTLSGAELQPPWTLAAEPEFLTRADGFPALMQAYPRLRWAAPAQTLSRTALYTALDAGRANMIAARAADPESSPAGACVLADDRRLLPPEDAAIVARFDSLAAHPGLDAALASLSGRIQIDQIRSMAAEVERGRSPAKVAARFVAALGN